MDHGPSATWSSGCVSRQRKSPTSARAQCAGLVDVRVDAQRRIYALRPAPLQELEVWLEKYRRLWEGNFQRLDALLDELKTEELKTKEKKRARAKR